MRARLSRLHVVIVLISLLTLTGSVAAASAPPRAGSPAPVILPDRTLQIGAPVLSLDTQPGMDVLRLMVTLMNTGSRSVTLRRDDFVLSAEGDMFGPSTVPDPQGLTSSAIGPTAALGGRLTFRLPAAAAAHANLVYRPGSTAPVVSVPLGKLTLTSLPTSQAADPTLVFAPFTPAGAGVSLATSSPTANVVEDDFARANQAGWGTSVNADGLPNVTWGMDGSGLSYVTISADQGVYTYPGAINMIGIASAGPTAYNGGDSLVRFTVSAVGQVTPYVVQNACADKSCYYGARLHTSQGKLELARRAFGGTGVLASVPFVASANTAYWMRLDVAGGTSATLRAKVWADGTAEPSAWMVTATDSSPLAANPAGAGGSWDGSGPGEQIAYTCYAFATSGLAAPCSSGSTTSSSTSSSVTSASTSTSSTATSTSSTAVSTSSSTSVTSSTTSTSSPTIQEHWLTGGAGEAWGTAIDAAGNVWFADPGCDFAPTCSSSAPPGEIGELPAGSGSPVFYRLPNISGNQPIFVTLDAAGNVWFTTPDNSMIGEFSPVTKSFTGQWAVTAGSGPWDLTFNQSKLWYTEHLVSAVGEFDPVTHTYQDFPTPSANSNPYGIAASDPANGNLVWFTENNSTVAKIAVLDLGNGNAISEYDIVAQPTGGLTPHMIALDGQGNPWWSEGFVRAVGVLNVKVATAGQCGTSSGDCAGVTEDFLPAPPAGCSSSHVSGIAVQQGGQLVWLDDSLSAQVGSFAPGNRQFTLYNLSNCNAHPHDGLNLDSALNVWWDEEFGDALGELTP